MVRLLPSKARIIISKYTIIAVFIELLQNAVLISGFFGEFQSMTRPKIVSSASTGIYMIEKGGGGAGSDADWAKALRDNEGDDPSLFEEELLSLTKKNSQLSSGAFLKNKKNDLSPKLKANQNLLTWLEENGDVYLKDQSNWGSAPHPLAISTETVDEITNESTGRGLLARRSINEGDELISIPLRLCMTINTAREALGNKLISSGTNEYLAIAAHLIYETFVLKEKSFWKPYLDVLPLSVEEVNPTFSWSDEDLAFLEGSPVVAATRSLQAKLGREYEAMKAKLKKYGGVIPEFPEESFSLQNWIWAFTILFSRAIRLQSVKEGEALALVPYADFINHSPFSTAYIDARESGSWLLKDGDQEVILYADRGYRKMEQIYISYGPKSNAELLLLYGFALERNPYNSVDVTVSIRPKVHKMVLDSQSEQDNDPLADEKIAFLQRVGREATVDFPCYADRYPIEMLEYLRLMQMTPEDTKGKSLSSFDYTRTVSAANEAAVLKSVVDAVKSQLSNYPNTEEEDAALIQDKSLFRMFNYNQRMAIRHRRNEKRLLKRTIAALEKQIRSRGLDAVELPRAGGSTKGQVLPGERLSIKKQKSSLENRLEKLGLPVDLNPYA